MPTTIINKLGKGSPDPADLAVGEIAQDEDTGTLYVKKITGEVVEVSSDGAGAGMVISANEPSDPVDGMQWLEASTAIVWVWDEDKWLEFPAAVSGDDYDDTQIKADLATETQDREAGDQALQGQIDGLSPYDDTQINADLAAETQARSDADADLQNQIDNLPTDSAPSTHVGDTAPIDPVEGQLWLNTDDGYLYAYYDNAGNPTWMAVEREGGSGGGTDPEPEPDPDPYWPNVAVLINCDDETDGSQNIVDASQKNQITVVNNAKVSTDNYKYGTGSLNLSAAGYLQCSNKSQAITSSTNFTLEMWVYRNPGAGYQYLYATGNSCQILLHQNKLKSFFSADGSTNYFLSLNSNSDVPAGEWVHLCITRSGGNWRLFINGEEDAKESSISTGIGPASYVQIGAFGSNQYRFDGLIDDLRLTKLIARPEYADASWEPPGKHSTEDGSFRTTVIAVDEPAVELQEDSNDADLS